MALIAGPTASGKSALAIALAQAHDGVVINSDASQVYSDLPILSAQPSPDEMSAVPHRLFGTIDGAQSCSAANWAALARLEIAKVHAERKLPILCGGTGLYLRTLLDGIAPVPEINEGVRSKVRSMATAEAYAALSREDPERAAQLAPADTARIARALEVVRSTGRSLLEWQSEKTGGIADQITLRPLILLPPRDWLRARCDARFVQMVDRGAAAEVERLLERNLPPSLPVMRAIGVPEIAGWLRGDISRETMIERATAATRQYAKRQYTWFSRQPPDDWPRTASEIDNNFLEQFVRKFQY